MEIFKVYLVLMATRLQLIAVNGEKGVCDRKTFKGSEGEITTPGYPHRLGFTDTCVIQINVESGGIELRFENIDLPIHSTIGASGGKYFDFDPHHSGNSKVMYIDQSTTRVVIILPKTFTGRYGGMNVHYRRIRNGVCRRRYMAHDSFKRIESPGYPSNYAVKSICEYHIDVFSKGHVVHISFQDMTFGPNDTFTVYDGKDNRVVLGPITGPKDWIQTRPTNSSSVKIIIDASDAPFVPRRYAFFYKQVPKGTCLRDNYESRGIASFFQSVGKPCTYIVRPRLNDWIVAFLKSIHISPRNFIKVGLKSDSNKEISNQYLRPRDSGRARILLDSLEKGNLFEIKQSANASFTLFFTIYKQITDSCTSYVVSEVIEKQISSPGYPGNIPRNVSCEYYIRSRDLTGIVYIRFSELFLSPGDRLSFHDPFDDIIIPWEWHNGTRNSEVYVRTNSSSVRVLLSTANTEPTVRRRFKFFHKTLFSETCVADYEGSSGQFSSLNRSCEYNIHLKALSARIELKFETLYIPKNQTIKIVQKLERFQEPLAGLHSKDSGKSKYFRSRNPYNVITIYADVSTVFSVSFKPFVPVSIINLHGPNGTLLSPYYPHSYLLHTFEPTTVIYHVQAPSAHVMLNFTEVKLSLRSRYYRDRIEVYDGNSSSAPKIGTISGAQPIELPVVFLSSSNYLMVKLLSFTNADPEKLYRFKAVYTTVTEKQVKYCKVIEWPHSHAERNLTFPGRSTRFFCGKGYIRKGNKEYIVRTCGINGKWQLGETLKCLKTCPRVDEKLKDHPSLSWYYTSINNIIYEGVRVIFHCVSNKDELHGPKEITCTAHGNYSALPPVCKEKPGSGSSNSGNINGCSFGVEALIMTLFLTALSIEDISGIF